jgi:predicted DNA-binding protein (MmcQ/YjbR family)
MMDSPPPDPLLTTLRDLCKRLPESRETLTFGHPAFQIGKKTFVVLDRYEGKTCLAFKLSLEEQAELIRGPRFFMAPYIGRYGWTCLDLEAAPLDWQEIEGLILRSYRLTAPARILARLDAA